MKSTLIASGLPLATVNAAIGEAARLVGTSDFYAALLAAFRSLVSHDIATMVRYSAVGRPSFLMHHGFSDALARQYETTFHVFDPFHRYWVQTERPGVVSLDMFPATATRQSRYVREFLQESSITDELGYFLPAMGRASVALFLERRIGRFLESERAAMEDFYPLFAGLESAHVNAVLAAAIGRGAGGVSLPLAIMLRDLEGCVIHASEAWRDLESRNTNLRRAAERLTAENAGEAVLDDATVLHRTRISPAHSSAPEGWLFTVEKSASSSTDYDQAIISKLNPTLTPREIDIVKLVLEGHPTATIAQRLKLQRGTVKNHRLRIYEKLDITSERELFLTYIQALQRHRANG
ncbi:response regulator transcription factor [Labrys sp. 22185]|uniref:helix-turn-helix transcriptional regulator n=1 Tax=Labrys sp. 22185 TaxID=3453888 RepID=UPI003F864645